MANEQRATFRIARYGERAASYSSDCGGYGERATIRVATPAAAPVKAFLEAQAVEASALVPQPNTPNATLGNGLLPLLACSSRASYSLSNVKHIKGINDVT